MWPYDKERNPFPLKPKELGGEFNKLEKQFQQSLEKGEPFSYGFSIISVNGRPIRQEIFSNQSELSLNQPQRPEAEREPLIDVIQEADKTKVLIELPGVDKKEIQLTSNDKTLEVSVDSVNRKFHKKIELPHAVGNPKAEYRNGVLEVSLKRECSEKAENVKID
ncbi:MAG: Hsp20/alpha crystallin family protein [Methanobacteriota archaeon]